MDGWTELQKQFPAGFRGLLQRAWADCGRIREIRVRAFKPVAVVLGDGEYFLKPDGELTRSPDLAYRADDREVRELVEYMAQYSLYAYESELKQGFLTLRGGHRVGIAGKVVTENGRIKNFQYISSVNIRLSHEVKGAAAKVLPCLFERGSLHNTLIISPPGCGKTTLLRDLVRQLSDGCEWFAGMNVAVVDERSEIGGAYMGIPQNDVGLRTDLLDCCPKAEGMMMLIRSMSPEVIAVDEIGGAMDVQAMENALRCGCRLIATIHGDCMEEVLQKKELQGLIEGKVFGRYIVLDKRKGVGHVDCVCDGDFVPVRRKG